MKNHLQYFRYKSYEGLKSLLSLTAYKINIIDLNDSSLWGSKDNKVNNILAMNDLIDIGEMLSNSKESETIVILPQNQSFKFFYKIYSNDYSGHVDIKDILDEFIGIIKYVLLEHVSDYIKDSIKLSYERINTDINGKDIESNFYFSGRSSEYNDVITVSKTGSRVTSIRVDNIILTTLDLNKENIEEYLYEIKLLKKEIDDAPDWMRDINIFDDLEQESIIKQNEEEIVELEGRINESLDILRENAKYKSILYTNGDYLVDIVFNILEELLAVDLSSFKDEKKEDFRILKGKKVFIGEIKGISSNVKLANVSQLDVHVQNYIDDNPDKEIDKIHNLLIINHQRNKPLENREEIHENIVKLAKRNGSLIIETSALLDILGDHRSGKISTEDCIDLFSKNEGLLEYKNS